MKGGVEMKIKRTDVWNAFQQKWCPKCGESTMTKNIRTGLPGIVAAECTKCGDGYQCNYLEDGEDEFDIPDHYKLPPEPWHG